MCFCQHPKWTHQHLVGFYSLETRAILSVISLHFVIVRAAAVMQPVVMWETREHGPHYGEFILMDITFSVWPLTCWSCETRAWQENSVGKHTSTGQAELPPLFSVVKDWAPAIRKFKRLYTDHVSVSERVKMLCHMSELACVADETTIAVCDVLLQRSNTNLAGIINYAGCVASNRICQQEQEGPLSVSLQVSGAQVSCLVKIFESTPEAVIRGCALARLLCCSLDFTLLTSWRHKVLVFVLASGWPHCQTSTGNTWDDMTARASEEHKERNVETCFACRHFCNRAGLDRLLRHSFLVASADGKLLPAAATWLVLHMWMCARAMCVHVIFLSRL